MNFEISKSLFDLFGNVDYIIADYSKVDQKVLSVLLQYKGKDSLFRELRQFVQREKGIRFAAAIDKTLPADEASLKTDNLFRIDEGSRKTKLVLKINEELLEVFNGADFASTFNGYLIEADDTRQLESFLKAAPSWVAEATNNVCVIKNLEEAYDRASVKACSRLVVTDPLFYLKK